MNDSHDRLANAATLVSGGATVFGVSVSTINEYLQMASFVVAIVSGACAAVYYYRKSKSHR